MSILEYYVRDAAHREAIEVAKAESLLLLRTSGPTLACRNMSARMRQIGVSFKHMDLLAYACGKDEKMAREFVEGSDVHV